MTPHSKLSARVHKARGLVESTLRHARTRGHGGGRTTTPRGGSPLGGRTRASTGADVRRIAQQARKVLRK